MKLLRSPEEKISSWDPPQYKFPLSSDKLFPELNKIIESESPEYKWSPHPESSTLDEVEKETYVAEEKKGEIRDLS